MIFYDFHCPIKLRYLALFAYICGYLMPSIGHLKQQAASISASPQLDLK
jgi:hypothetical protein